MTSVPPSLCGSFLASRGSLVALTWTITTVLTWLAFLLAIVLTVQIQTHYVYLERLYASNDDYNNNNNNNNNGDNNQDHNNNENKDAILYALLASTSSRSMTFVALYTMTWAVALSWYGSTAIVGFTSLRGIYIAPCFSSRHSKLQVGIFGGAIVIFANLLLLCAVIFGEFRVEDYREGREREEYEPYAVERIATVLAVTCMFLSVLYTMFSILLFLSHTHSPDHEEDILYPDDIPHHSKPLVTITDRETSGRGFITMESSRSSDRS